MRTTPLKLSFTLSSTWKKLQSILWMKKSAHFTLKDCIYWRILYKAWYTCWLSNNGQGYKYRIIYCWYTMLSALNANEMKIIKSKTILNQENSYYYIKHFLWDWFHFLLKCTILSYFWNKKYISKRNAYFSLESVYVNFHIKFCDKPRLQKVGNSFSQRWEYFTYVEISFSFKMHDIIILLE